MKTNISIELTNDERMNLGQKFYNKKRMITRADLNHIVKKFIGDVLEATPPTPKQVDEDPLLAKEWSSLTQLKNYLEKPAKDRSTMEKFLGPHVDILEFNGFELIVKEKNKNYLSVYTLGDRLYKKKKGLQK